MVSLASLACAVPILEALHENSTISCHNGLPKNVDFRVEFEEVEGRVDDNRRVYVHRVLQPAGFHYTLDRERRAKITLGGYTYFAIINPRSGQTVLRGRVWGDDINHPWGILRRPSDENEILFEVQGGSVSYFMCICFTFDHNRCRR
ncbi:hypothetical protein FB446DRAFT_429132 [Lentinula raphanica]|nr:hypothetical protein FB446DRAFT_429132 [Lentinula raphanica]